REQHPRGTILEVEPRALQRSVDHRHRLHPQRLQLVLRRTQLHELAPAEGTVQAAEQGDEDRTASAIVVERDLALSIDRGQREVGSGITGVKERGWHLCCPFLCEWVRVNRETGAPRARLARARRARTPPGPSA